jgi:tripartite-type tricarboxylate transporter receptor subunit TctC
MRNVDRRVILASAAGMLAGAAIPEVARAQSYPSKPIRIICPFAPGGVTDLVSRTMAQGLSVELGQSVVVENRAGASGIPGAEAVARAEPDGYTLMMGNISTLAINAATFAKLPYDPQKSFTPISMVARQPLLVAVNPNVPAKSISELVALGKSKPGRFSYGSAGASLRLATEAFSQATGLQMTHVPYRGSGPAMTDLVAGHIDLLFDAFSSLYPFTQEGKLRALAITSSQRSSLAPDLPTLVESGVPQIDVTSWQAIAAPAGLPAAIAARLVEAVHKTLGNAAIQLQLTKQGVEPISSSPQQLAQYAAEEIERWKTVAQVAGIKPE